MVIHGRNAVREALRGRRKVARIWVTKTASRESWLDGAPVALATAEEIARRYRAKEIDALDSIRQYGVILDWGSGELLPKTTEGFRVMLRRRTVPFWEHPHADLREPHGEAIAV